MSARAEQTLPASRRPSRKSTSSPRKVMDQENATIDLGVTATASRKKSRSKSMGPGGLDPLKPSAGNRRASLAVSSRPPRSILKSTLPIPTSLAQPRSSRISAPSAPSLSPARENLASPARNDGNAAGTRIAIRTEEEQQAAAREREEKERAELEKEINDNREARRKSLANRRVSFAAEATLHTFHEEYAQDSTTSTEATRRASQMAARQSHDAVSSDPSEPPSTPPSRTNEMVPESPASQRGQHHHKSRRSSLAPSEPADDRAGFTAASSAFGSDSDAGDSVAEIQIEEASEADSDSDNDGTMVTVEAEEVTSTSVGSRRSALESQGDTTSSLDGALALAAQRAHENTQDFDQDGDIIATFTGWDKKTAQTRPKEVASMSDPPSSPMKEIPSDGAELSMEIEMEMTRAAGKIFPHGGLDAADAQSEDVSMDETGVYGDLLSPVKILAHRGNVAGDSVTGDEDMSMEMTNVIDGFLSRRTTIGAAAIGGAVDQTLDIDMDMTLGVGRILNAQAQETEEATQGAMEFTTAIGQITDEQETPKASQISKNVIGQDELESSPVRTPVRSTSKHVAARRASLAPSSANATQRTPIQVESPAKTTVQRTLTTSQSRQSTTAVPRQNSQTHTPSPSPQAKPVLSARRSPRRSSVIFHKSPNTGNTAPMIVLTPQRRRLSGQGLDRSGLGSPRVSDILERRGSIGDTASDFTPISINQFRKVVAFGNPRRMEEDLDKERREEEDHENKRSIMEREADNNDGEDATINLRERIQNLSPKKPLRGRKSLHVGSAKGLLGKRPLELEDESEDDLLQDGVKRLKGLQDSPVKKVHLQQPPSKAETSGRLIWATENSTDANADVTPSNRSSPVKAAATPRGQTRFKPVADAISAADIDYEAPTPSTSLAALRLDEDERKIHLQDFLNLTNIRFMELTTTKRRHTVFPTDLALSATKEGEDDTSFEKCVVAGACTIPMLELYQHSCRELKTYISEGRRMIREIETETLEENPPLFQEYMTATPEFKMLMDNQFKNVKTHARFLSKAMWYEWRMKLQDGLKEGLHRTVEGLAADEKVLDKKHKLLASVLPGLREHFNEVEKELSMLEGAAAEMAEGDPHDLQNARDELAALDDQVAEQQRELLELQQQLEQADTQVKDGAERKVTCQIEIHEADKVREECRGWSLTEISKLKANVSTLEQESGWSITSMTGSSLSLTYKKQVTLAIDPSAIASGQRDDTDVDIWHVNGKTQHSVETDFFVDCMRTRLSKSTTQRRSVRDTLHTVKTAWDAAEGILQDVRLLNLAYPTTVSRVSDSLMRVSCTALIVARQTKINIAIDVSSVSEDGDLSFVTTTSAKIIYGEAFNAAAMGDFLEKRIAASCANKIKQNKESWGDVVMHLQAKLLTSVRS